MLIVGRMICLVCNMNNPIKEIHKARQLRKRLKQQRKQIAILKQALRFYANKNKYKPDSWGYTHACEHDSTPDIVYDGGEVATMALLNCNKRQNNA